MKETAAHARFLMLVVSFTAAAATAGDLKPGQFVILVIVTVDLRISGKMPVRSTGLINPMGLLDDLSSDMLPSSVDVISARPNTEPVLSDDIWDKFELDFPELSGIDDIFDEIDTSGDSLLPFLNGICQIRNHDCMWAGHCASKEHPTDEPRFHKYCAINSSASGSSRAPIPTIKQEIKPPAQCQQSLLKPTVRAAACVAQPMMPTNHTPQTPPMSDDEESKCKPTQILNPTIAECKLEDDSDLCDYRGDDYFEDDEDLEVNVTDCGPTVKESAKPNIRSCQFAAESDHSYHKDKNASMHNIPNLGIDTPSDSGESIFNYTFFSAKYMWTADTLSKFVQMSFRLIK